MRGRRALCCRVFGQLPFAIRLGWSAHWAVTPTCSVPNSGLPFMPALTDPPNFFVAAWRYARRHQTAIPGGMPLVGKIWVIFGKVVVSTHSPVRAIRTTIAMGSIINDCLPRVSALAQPPGLSSAARCHVEGS